ncbi:MAG: murein biosynthesis integral membrane protein MurJ [Chthoniobacterales bacterium]|nr:murein biosynthesis integral membrane protein MurJ [Chthoniobacterales bacterium]
MAGPAPQRVSARATGVVGVAILCSRLLGLVREVVIASLFGASRSLDAFLTAFRAPNMLRDLFAEGALSTAFVTTFSKKIQSGGDQSAWALANKVATLTAVFMSIVVIIGILIAPFLVSILAPGFDAEKAALTVVLARVMYPFILLVSLAALVMGMLNAKHVFGMPAMASSFFNIGSIIGGVSLGWWMDPAFGPRALIGLAMGTLIGGFLQLAVQIPSLFKVGFVFRPDFNWRDEGVRKVLQLMGPAVIAASAVQVNVLINSIFASYMEDGAVSWLNIAFRLMQLPLGIFGVAVATVTLPLVSRSAAAGNIPEFRGALAHALRLVMLLTIPSAIGLIILAEPIISLIYEHGRFTAAATQQTAGALRFYAAGLVGYAAIKVLAPAFYALDKRHLPMIVSLLSIIENFSLNWLFTRYLGFGHRGLAMSTALVALTDFVILYVMMRRYVGALETGTMMKTLGKLFLAGAGLAAICWCAVEFYLGSGSHLATLPKLVAVMTTVAIGVTAFFGTAYLLRVAELRDMVAMVQRRLKR